LKKSKNSTILGAKILIPGINQFEIRLGKELAILNANSCRFDIFMVVKIQVVVFILRTFIFQRNWMAPF
jgi:hypothetical protein